jgi:predicted secreted protein
MTFPMNKKLQAIIAACALSASLSTLAAAQPPMAVTKDPEGVLTLATSATVEVPNDWITVQFSTTREGADPAAVQADLKAALGVALNQARLVEKGDGHVEVRGGGFSLQPRTNAKGQVNGWSGTTSMWVQGRDLGTIAELVGRVQTLTVASLDYSVSREARERVEGDVAAQAIARFRAKAADYARAFGYTTFTVREANVGVDNGQPRPRPYQMRASSFSSVSEAMPVEAGSGSVTANVNGSVQLK